MKIKFYFETAKQITQSVQNEQEPPRGHAFIQQVCSVILTQNSTPRNFYGIQFMQDENGLFVETDSFLGGVPRQILELELPIRLVTLYDEGKTGDPLLGVCESTNVSAIIDRIDRRRNASFSSRSESLWRIRIMGKEFEDVVELYRKFRRGVLELTETWEDLPAKDAATRS